MPGEAAGAAPRDRGGKPAPSIGARAAPAVVQQVDPDIERETSAGGSPDADEHESGLRAQAVTVLGSSVVPAASRITKVKPARPHLTAALVTGATMARS